MDEIFKIEKEVGTVNSIISLTFHREENSLNLEENKLRWEEFPESIEPVSRRNTEGNLATNEEMNENEAGENEEEGEIEVKPQFKPKDFAWTITDREAKNLLSIFNSMKGKSFLPDMRDSEGYSK
jgi:hypothetical protein